MPLLLLSFAAATPKKIPAEQEAKLLKQKVRASIVGSCLPGCT